MEKKISTNDLKPYQEILNPSEASIFFMAHLDFEPTKKFRKIDKHLENFSVFFVLKLTNIKNQNIEVLRDIISWE